MAAQISGYVARCDLVGSQQLEAVFWASFRTLGEMSRVWELGLCKEGQGLSCCPCLLPGLLGFSEYLGSFACPVKSPPTCGLRVQSRPWRRAWPPSHRPAPCAFLPGQFLLWVRGPDQQNTAPSQPTSC